MFSNPTIQSIINQFNGTSFGGLIGFGMYSSGTVYYYVMDYGANKVFILNEQWSFISFKVLTNPSYMINIGNSLYMTGNLNVWKVDKDLNILINYNPAGYPYHRGLSYNPSNGFIYVVALNLYEIHVFNLNLNLIRRFSTSPHQPMSITVSSNQLYVGTYGEGVILVYQNEILVNQFNCCNGKSDYVTSILFDTNGYMATTCEQTKKLYLFSPNGSFTGKSITTPTLPMYIGFDSKGLFILSSQKQISIYNDQYSSTTTSTSTTTTTTQQINIYTAKNNK